MSTNTAVYDNLSSKDFAHDNSAKAPESLAVAAGSGAVIGSTLVWLAGIGLLAIPGVGPFVAAGANAVSAGILKD